MEKSQLAWKLAEKIEALRVKAAGANMFSLRSIIEEMGKLQAQLNLLTLELIREAGQCR